jgi:hypothetical protein
MRVEEELRISGESLTPAGTPNTNVQEEATPQPPMPPQEVPRPAEPEAPIVAIVPAPSVTVPPVTVPPPAVTTGLQPPASQQESPESAESLPPATEAPKPAESESGDTEPLTPLPPVPSRTARIEVNQYLEIPCHGAGWAYLGELEYQGLVSYIDRKQIGADTVFTIRADKTGQTLLQFYREDMRTHAEINDYFELTIVQAQAPPDNQVSTPAERAGTRSEVPTRASTAPSDETSSITPRASVQAEATPHIELLPPEPSQDAGAPALSSLSPPALPVDLELYDKAEKAFQEANYQEAAECIGQSLELATDDKGLFLKGQIYEAKSPVRDLRLALNAYQQLADTFPMSLLRPDALKRITYLKRFYFTIH